MTARPLVRQGSMGSGGMGGPQFMRPTEYDPTLATTHTTPVPSNGHVHRSHEDKLRDDLGLESGSDNDSGDESKGERRKKRDELDGDDQEELSAAQQEFEALVEELKAANAARVSAEAKAKRAEERVEQIQQMAKSAKAVLNKQYGDQLRLQQQKVDELKEQLVEDDAAIDALKKQVMILERGGSDSAKIEIPKALKELKESRELTRLNTELRYRVDELVLAGQGLQAELSEVSKEREELRTKLASAPLPGVGGEVQLADAERNRYHAEIKKLRDVVTELHAKASASLTSAPAPAPAPAPSPLSPSGSPSTDSGFKLKETKSETKTSSSSSSSSVSGPAPSSTPAPPVTGMSEVDVSKYTDKIRSLESLLASTEAKLAHALNRAKEAETTLASTPTTPSTTPPPTTPSTTPTPNPELEAKVATLEEMLRNADTIIKRKDEENKLIKAKAQEKLNQASAAIKKLKTDVAAQKAISDSKAAAFEKLQQEAGAGITHVEEQNNVLKSTIGGLVTSMRSRREVLGRLRAQCAETKTAISSLKSDVAGLGALIPEMGPIIAKALKAYQEKNQGAYQELAKMYQKEVKARKDLFNQVQELKGNIRVYCRIRPANSKERSDPTNSDVITFPAEDELKIVNEKKGTHNFDFEKIFRPGSTQEEVFVEVSGLVTSVMDGFNVCIFAYGQTGSGKTYTMEGPKEDPGVNFRALGRLFEIAEERKTTTSYDISVTMLEVYNETLQDMLGSHEGALKAVKGDYGMEVKDLTIRSAATYEDVIKILKQGAASRTTSPTRMNDKSSRSHLITSVYVRARDLINPKETLGKLHLIDLAGSERVSRSGVTGDGLKEAQSINLSLSALGDVIAARATKAPFIPYRNSVLTHLLQDSLEKNSKTLMFVQCSPCFADSSETVCALRFAHRVRQVELGKATATKVGGEKKESKTPSKK